MNTKYRLQMLGDQIGMSFYPTPDCTIVSFGKAGDQIYEYPLDFYLSCSRQIAAFRELKERLDEIYRDSILDKAERTEGTGPT